MSGVWRALVWLLAWLAVAGAEPVELRVVAANLTCGRHPSYAPDRNQDPEGAGARILKALEADLVLIQEFNTDIPMKAWVEDSFGPGFHFSCEADAEIPNGIVSRYPILASGEWDDPTQTNRDFAWAKIKLPNGRVLWAVSVHWYSQKSAVRVAEAQALLKAIEAEVPEEDLLVIGGDLNTRSRRAPAIDVLATAFPIGPKYPVDQAGNGNTNAKRSRPYDWVVADAELAKMEVPVKFASEVFPHGLVFDSRVFKPLPKPVLVEDSGRFQMLHMAVVRDFLVTE
ncbi:MAG: endonuclease/exonuclease/phosphatase family protein [Verrucomicrobiota bacterium]